MGLDQKVESDPEYMEELLAEAKWTHEDFQRRVKEITTVVDLYHQAKDFEALSIEAYETSHKIKSLQGELEIAQRAYNLAHGKRSTASSALSRLLDNGNKDIRRIMAEIDADVKPGNGDRARLGLQRIAEFYGLPAPKESTD